MKKYSVVIVDDHRLIASAIAGIINKYSHYQVLYEVEHGKALIKRMEIHAIIPDIVLLDISMPVMDGFATAKWLQQNHPNVLILTLSMQNDDMALIKMLKNGAKGYLLKNIHPSELEKALNSLVTYGSYFPEWATSKIINEKLIGQSDFNEKESEFLKYCCTELGYKEIAEKMNCSSRTIEGYRDAVSQRINVKTRVGLAIYAMKWGYCNS